MRENIIILFHTSVSMIRLLVTFLIITGLFTGFFASAGAEPVRQDNFGAIELYNRAIDEASAGRFEEAVNLTDQALSIQPNFTMALITRTGLLLELEQVSEAEVSLKKALELDNKNPSVLATAASVRLKTGEFKEAIRYADDALLTDPSLIEAWIIKGTAHGALGEYEEEHNASESALTLDPDNPSALFNLRYAEDNMQPVKKSPATGLLSPLALMSVGLFIVHRQRG